MWAMKGMWEARAGASSGSGRCYNCPWYTEEEGETQSAGEQGRAPHSWGHRSGTIMGFAAGALFSPMLCLTRLFLVGPTAPGFWSQLLCHYL